MENSFYEMVTANPVVAAVKDSTGLDACLQCESIQVVFVLYGDICTIGAIVNQVHEAGKCAIVHADLINGLSNKEISVDFLRQNTQADGIISTRQSFIRRAKELHLYTVLRVFILDSISLSSLPKLEAMHPDFIEVLPGTMPKTLSRICRTSATPILAGGLIADKEDVVNALNAGAAAISTTNPEVWNM